MDVKTRVINELIIKDKTKIIRAKKAKSLIIEITYSKETVSLIKKTKVINR